MRMRMLNIGLDMEGVIADSVKLKAYVAEKLFGQRGKIYWANFKREVVVGRGWLTDEEYSQVGDFTYNYWRFGQLMKPVPGALTFISALRNEGHNLCVVTSKDKSSFSMADKWLQENGFDFLPRLGIGQKKSKLGILQALGADIFIDDDLEKLMPLIGVVKHLYLFSWPFNEPEKLPLEIKRLQNDWRHNPWKEFYLEVCRVRRTINQLAPTETAEPILIPV